MTDRPTFRPRTEPTDTRPLAERVSTFSTADLLATPNPREFLLVVGPFGAGKSCLAVSFASFTPGAMFYVLDLEHKFPSALRSFGTDAPSNITYIPLVDMNEATEALHGVLAELKPGDWVVVESGAQLWEAAQDMGYQAVTGTQKAAYMERRRAQARTNPDLKPLPVTPSPDDLWSIVKGAHDGAFLNKLRERKDVNVLITTTATKAKESRPGRKENADRVALRKELGIDFNIGGSPQLPGYAETTLYVYMENNRGKAQVLRDNLSAKDDPRVLFEAEDRKAWASSFYINCRY